MDHILEFPNIAWSVICLEKVRSPLIDASNPFAGVGSVALNEVLGEQKDVFTTLAKRWNMDRKDVQPVKEVPSKSSRTDLS